MKHGAKPLRTPRTRWWGGILSFIAAVLIFGAVLLLPRNDTAAPPTETAGEYQPPRTVLLFVHDGGGRLSAAVLVRFDDAVTVTGYPKQTEVVYGTALRPLWACYEQEGAGAAAYLTGHTDGAPDAVLRLSVEAVAALADRLGNGIVLDGQLVTGYRMTEWLRDEGETVTAQATMTARCVAAMLERYFTPTLNLEEAFHLVAALSDDRLIAAQFLTIREELARLAATGNGRPCRVIVPTGRVVGVGDERRFVPQAG